MFGSIKSVKIALKLGVVLAAMGVPILVLVMLFVDAKNEQIAFTRRELSGVEYLAPLRGLLEHLSQHQAATAGALEGDAGLRAKIEGLQTAVDQDFADLDTMDRSQARGFGSGEKLKELKQAWRYVVQTSLKLEARDSMERHDRLIAGVIEQMRIVSDQSNLSLDPDLVTNYLKEIVVTQVPAAVESVGRLRNLAVAGAARPQWTPEEQAQIKVLAGTVDRTGETIRRGLNVAFSRDSSLEPKLNPPVITAVRDAEQWMRPLRESSGGQPGGSAEKAYAAAATAQEGFFKLFDAVLPDLRALLAARAAKSERDKNGQLAGATLVVGFAFGLVFLINRGITRQLGSITGVFDQIGAGDYTARAKVISDDELGAMALSLNAMLDSTLTLIQSSEERHQIQKSIQKLLDDISGLAEGDLTREAEVTTDITAAIADSFNLVIAELRQLLQDVQRATLQVSSSAGGVLNTAERLAKGSQGQARQILEASRAIEEMATSIQQVSSSAATATGVAEQALQKAKMGAEVMHQTVEGMNGIRAHVQGTSKRLKSLGERSQEIGEIVQLIADIADRTSILALNASIQAAMAGDAGKGFAVVADEVERLAERAADGTKRVSALIKSIQTDTSEAVAAMEDTTKEVVAGSTLTNTAGQALSDIETVSLQLSDLIRSISRAAEQQARGSDSISKSMGEISVLTQETAEGADRAALSVQELTQLSEHLRASVRRFRLPGAEDREAETMLAG